MEETLVATGQVNVIGLSLSIKNCSDSPVKSSREELQRQLRDTLRSHAEDTGAMYDKEGKMPCTFTIEECGESITFDDTDDVPFADIPCSCGNPTHWLVKYEEEL